MNGRGAEQGDPAPAPWLLALMGAPGSGKSTLGRALSCRLGWPLVDKDDVRDLLDDTVPDAGGLAYAIMFNVARRQLLQGLSVVCDSPFAYRRCYERAQEIARETTAHLAVVECRCPDEAVWRRRIEARQALDLPGHHTTDWAAVRAFQQRTAADAGPSPSRGRYAHAAARALHAGRDLAAASLSIECTTLQMDL